MIARLPLGPEPSWGLQPGDPVAKDGWFLRVSFRPGGLAWGQGGGWRERSGDTLDWDLMQPSKAFQPPKCVYVHWGRGGLQPQARLPWAG